MSYIRDNIEPGERIVCTAKHHPVAYITALLYLLLLMAPGRIIGLASSELALTDKRLLGRSGLFRRRSYSIPYKRITIAKSRRGLLGLMFDYGSLLIRAEDGGRILFRGISHPIDLELQCNEFAEIAALGRSLSKDMRTDRPHAFDEKPPVARDGPKLESKPPVMEKSPVLKAPDESRITAKNYKDPNAW